MTAFMMFVLNVALIITVNNNPFVFWLRGVDMSMLQEEYNLTDEGLKQLLYDIWHPSMEAAIRREKMYKTYLSNVDVEYDGESEVVDFKDLDIRLEV